MFIDKKRAEKGEWRIKESTLLEIARKYKATVGSVERDIRTVIRVCWENGYDQLQSYSLRPLYVRPTAGEFFDILVAYLSRSKPVLQAV